MLKSSKFTLTFLFFLSISLSLSAQTVTVTPPIPTPASPTVAPPAPAPATPGTAVPSPAAFPEYTVRPAEDLNSFGLSTLGDSTEDNYREAPGTLGTSKKRISNAEANKIRIEKKKAEQQEQRGSEEEIIRNQINNKKPKKNSVKYKKSKLITWTDENGNVHITNDIGNVPQRYMESVEYK